MIVGAYGIRPVRHSMNRTANLRGNMANEAVMSEFCEPLVPNSRIFCKLCLYLLGFHRKNENR